MELLSAKQVLGQSYETIVPENPPMPYYVAILLGKHRARRLGAPSTVPFRGSRMGRQLLSVSVELVGSGDPPLLLATAHLESTKDFAEEQKKQLLQSFQYLIGAVGQAPPRGLG